VESPQGTPLVAILGPTGSGKSTLALEIASVFDGEIVNCDSLQVFRHFDIGTAKLSQAQRRGIPHYLIDIADPTETFTAGEYSRRARVVLQEIAERGRLPVIAGGTGFYLKALLDGLSPAPERDLGLRARLSSIESRRPGHVHRLLQRLDRDAAARIHANDVNKSIRALEIRLIHGAPIRAAGRNALTGFHAVKIGLNPPREMLHDRINQRVIEMFGDGLVEEVRSILARGIPPDAKPFESLGYKQALQMQRGELTREQAIELTQTQTRQYAKRQMTWFRRERDVHWLEGFGDSLEIRSAALDFIRHARGAG